MARTLLVAAILAGTSTLAVAQTASAPLIVRATVVSNCTVNVPRRVPRSGLSTMPVDVACVRGRGADARVRRPPASAIEAGHALVVINF